MRTIEKHDFTRETEASLNCPTEAHVNNSATLKSVLVAKSSVNHL